MSCVAATGCDSQGTPGSSGGAPGSGGAGGGSGGAGGMGGGGGGGGGSPDGGTNCGVQDFTLDRLPPDLLIILDKSGSMNDTPPAGGGTKWDQVTAAIDQTVMSLDTQIRWGLEFFPSDAGCGVGSSVDVTVALGNAQAITSAIGGKSPGGNTPTRQAMLSGGAYLAGLGDPNPKYLLLATDGQPNCPTTGPQRDPDATAAEQAVADVATMGVHTFVIGIAVDSTADAVLNQMAINGGEPQPGPTKYYPVSSQADLVTALNMIAGRIISCTFPLTMAPPSPGDVTVTANNGQVVPRDPSHMNGWDFGAANMSIQFYGSWCQMLQAGSITNVHAIFGCPPVGLPPF